MMLVDGCALLCYILCVCLGHDLEDFNIRDQDMSLLHQDAFLLKNQLPYQLLLDRTKMVELESANYFWTTMFQEFFSINDESIFQKFMGMKSKEAFVKKMKNYCTCLFLPINQKKLKPGEVVAVVLIITSQSQSLVITSSIFSEENSSAKNVGVQTWKFEFFRN